MNCFCLPVPSLHSKRTFHWPNFSFAQSHQTFHTNQESTFWGRRRSSFFWGHTTDHLPGDLSDRVQNRRSLKSVRTAPAIPGMAEKYDPPPGPPPNYQKSPAQTDRSRQDDLRSQQPVSRPMGGGPSNPSQLASNNPFREDASSVPPGAGRSSTIGSPPAENPSRTFLTSPAPTHTPTLSASSKQNSDTEMTGDEFQPPPGPPPGYKAKEMQYEPPPGPPPGLTGTKSPDPPPYDPWLGSDDHLRPPPSFSSVLPQHTTSPAANADFGSAEHAHTWCRENGLWQPMNHPPETIRRIERGDIRLTVPPNTTEVTQYFPNLGHSYVRTTSSIDDTIMLSDLPIFAAIGQSPIETGRPKTVYFEVHVLSLGDRYNPRSTVEPTLAIGYCAAPYPSWRLPGWHRGSLGVHSDDGRRYVDNSYGGTDFVGPFKKGDVVGVGMTFEPPVHGGPIHTHCECFFTRNGRVEGKWDLHEEMDADADAGTITGLEGDFDLLAAVGVSGPVELECIFRPEEWLFKTQ